MGLTLSETKRPGWRLMGCGAEAVTVLDAAWLLCGLVLGGVSVMARR